MNEIFNRNLLRSPKKLSVLAWIVMSVSWSSKWTSGKSGHIKKPILLKHFQVIGSVNRIASDTKVSIGYIHEILKRLEKDNHIILIPKTIGRKRKAINVIELKNPELRKFVQILSESKTESKPPSRNRVDTESKTESITESKTESNISTRKDESPKARPKDYNIQKEEGNFLEKNSPLHVKEKKEIVPPWRDG